MANAPTATASANRGGIGFFGLLTLIFVIAKITGYITWSWWLVFAPMLFGFGLFFLIMLIVLIVALAAK